MITLEMSVIAMNTSGKNTNKKNSIKVARKDMTEIMGLIYFGQFLIW